MIDVLFVCLKNDGMSQIAEGLLNKIGHNRFKAQSAGFFPATIHPLVIEQMRDLAINPVEHYPKSILKYKAVDFDYVIWLGAKIPELDFPVKGRRSPVSLWRIELSESHQKSPQDYAKELSREAHLLLTRMHLFVLSHHEESELVPVGSSIR